MMTYSDWIYGLSLVEDMVPTADMKSLFSKQALNAVGKLLYKNYYDPNKCEYMKLGKPRQTIEGKKFERGIIIFKVNYPKTKDKEELERQKETMFFAALAENKYNPPKLFNITSGTASFVGDTKEFGLLFPDNVKLVGFYSPIVRLSQSTKAQRDNADKENLENRLAMGDKSVMTLQQRLAVYKRDRKLSEIRDKLIMRYGEDIDNLIADISSFDINSYISRGSGANQLRDINKRIDDLSVEMNLQDKLNFVRLFFADPDMSNSKIKEKVEEDPGYGIMLNSLNI